MDDTKHTTPLRTKLRERGIDLRGMDAGGISITTVRVGQYKLEYHEEHQSTVFGNGRATRIVLRQGGPKSPEIDDGLALAVIERLRELLGDAS